MKTKKCNYCEENIEYKEKDITSNEDYGRGFFCTLCGTFIKIEKKIPKSTYSRRKTYGYYPRRRQIKKKNKNIFVYSIIAIIFMPIFFFMSQLLLPQLSLPNSQPFSTFQIVCNNTGYDMSDQIPISISIPKEGVEFNDSIDMYTLSNYYLLIDSQFPIDLEVDLRPFKFFMIEINPNHFNPNYTYKIGLHFGKVNYNYQFYASYNVTAFPYFSFIERF